MLDKILSSPVSTGVITGLLDMSIAGQEETIRQKETKEQAQIDWNLFAKKEDYKNTVAARTAANAAFIKSIQDGGPNLAKAMLSIPNSGEYAAMYQYLRGGGVGNSLLPAELTAIQAVALQDPKFDETQKEMLTIARDNPAAAKNLLNDESLTDIIYAQVEGGGNEQQKYTRLGALIAANVTRGLSGDQQRTITEIQGSDNPVERAKQIMDAYAVGSDMRIALEAITRAPKQIPYKPISDNTFTQLQAATKDAPEGQVGSVLEQIDSIIANINKQFYEKDDTGLVKKDEDGDPIVGELSPQAALDVLKLKTMSQAYGTRDAPDDILELFQSAVEHIKGLTGSEAERRVAAKSVLPQLTAVINEIESGAPVDVADVNPEVALIYSTIQGIAQTTEKLDKNIVSFYANSGESVMDVNDDRLLSPRSKVDKINRKSDLSATYKSMSPESKAQFEALVTSRITEHVQGQREQKTFTDVGGRTVTSGGLVDDYRSIFPELYKLPFVKNHLHTTLGVPKSGEVFNQKGTLVGQDQTNVATDQIRYSTGDVLNLPKAAKFAERRGVSLFELINGNDMYHDMIDASDMGNHDRLFEAALVLQESGLFNKLETAPLSEQSYRDIGFTLIRLGVTDPAEQATVISSVMRDNVPEQFKPVAGKVTVPTQEYIDYLATEIGQEINLKTLSDTGEADAEFLRNVNGALAQMNQFGDDQSALIRGFQTKYLELIGHKDGFLKTVAGAFSLDDTALGDFIRMEDMQNTEYVSNSQNRDGVLNAAQQHINNHLEQVAALPGADSQFLEAQAKLASLQVTLAYSFAKTMDPSGRISERDFQAALNAVSGSIFSPKVVSEALLRGFAKKAQQNIVRKQQTFRSINAFLDGDSFRGPTKKELQRVRAIKHIRPIQRNLEAQANIERYRITLSENFGDINRLTGGRDSPYDIAPATDLGQGAFGSANGIGQDVYTVRRRIYGTNARYPFGRLDSSREIYVFRDGTLLSRKQIQQLRNMTATGDVL